MRSRARSATVATALAAGALSLALAAAPAAAQQTATQPAPAPTAPTAEEERAVLAVVTGLFDAMRSRDTTTLRAAFAPGTQLTSVAMRDGQPTVKRDPVDTWINSVAGAPPGLVLDERIYSPRVHISDGLAAVWVEYDLYVGERFSHCGVDAFLLVRLADGWKVSSLADTRRREGCPTR